MLGYLIERELHRNHSGGWRYADKSELVDSSNTDWFICSNLKCQFTWYSCIDTWSGRGNIGEYSVKYCPRCGEDYN